MNKKLLLCVVSLFVVNICADIDLNVEDTEFRNCVDDNYEDQCCSSLSVKDLCARKIKVRQGLFRELCAHEIKSRFICTENLGITGRAVFHDVCANNISATNLCLTGTARFNEVCSPYGASVELSANVPYTLGDPVNFDLIVDDPNGDVTLLPFFKYTVPVSGYYVASVQVDANNFAGANAILGVPVSRLNLKINSVDRRQSYLPFLTFSNFQQSDLSFLLFLKAGDVLTVTYEMLVVDDSAGLIPYVGTATIVGGPERTIFNVHYIASLCSPTPCEPCTVTPCSSSCIPLPNSCAKIVY